MSHEGFENEKRLDRLERALAVIRAWCMRTGRTRASVGVIAAIALFSMVLTTTSVYFATGRFSVIAFTLALIVPVVTGLPSAYVLLTLIERLGIAEKALTEAATHDDLTGLFNRRYVMNLLAREQARTVRTHDPLTVILMDVDHFKRVNDRYGHMVGDEVLRELARRTQSTLRAYDVLARYGGEEFLCVLPGTPLEGGRDVAIRLLARVNAAPFETSAGAIHVTMSAGIATLEVDEPDVQSTLRVADGALYRAKKSGRNRAETGDAAIG